MSSKKKGQLAPPDGEWCKHLRPGMKRDAWKRERQAGKKFINQELKEDESNGN